MIFLKVRNLGQNRSLSLNLKVLLPTQSSVRLNLKRKRPIRIQKEDKLTYMLKSYNKPLQTLC